MKRTPLKRSPMNRTRPKAGDDPAYLAFIRTHPCIVCRSTWVEAAHVGERGLGQKCSDREALPMCAHCHRTGPEAHHVIGKVFWVHHGLDSASLIEKFNRMYEESK